MVLMLAPAAIYAFVINNWFGSIFYTLFIALAAIILISGFSCFIIAFDKKDRLSKLPKSMLALIGIILVAAGSAGHILLGIFVYNAAPIAVAVVLSSFVSFLFTMLMKKRTKNGIELLGKLLGFKEFIKRAELDRIKKLVEENPSYFYNVLPYAYVLGLSKKWAKNFEGIEIQPPSWYSSSEYTSFHAFNSVMFMHSFNRAASSMQQGFSVPASSGGSGSGGFGGGGFGGSFTGGGSGGFGGGRW
jgi:uncharacterized membrane protein